MNTANTVKVAVYLEGPPCPTGYEGVTTADVYLVTFDVSTDQRLFQRFVNRLKKARLVQQGELAMARGRRGGWEIRIMVDTTQAFALVRSRLLAMQAEYPAAA